MKKDFIITNEAYRGSKEILKQMPEVIPLLYDVIDREITTKEVAEALLSMGFNDITQRVESNIDYVGKGIEITQISQKSTWVTGTIQDYQFEASVYDEPSHFGIENSRTSKLAITKDNDLVIRFDRGWDVEPKTIEETEMVDRIVEYLQTLPIRFEDNLTL